MAKFDIEYSKALPTGKPGSVRASMDVDTGQAAIGRAIQQFGGTLQQSYQQVVESEERLQVAAGRRKIKGYIIAAQNSATGEDERDEEIWKKAEEDINAIQYKSQRVNDEIQIYRDSVMPTAIDGFGKKHIGMKAKNVHDSFVVNGQDALAAGDLVGYQELLDARLEAKDITPAMHKSLSDSAFGDSLLQQARDLISSEKAEDKKRGLGILENMQKLDDVDLSTEQKEYQARLLKVAKKVNRETVDKAISAAIIEVDNLRNKSVVEKQEAAQKIKQDLIDAGVEGDELQRYFAIINEWAGEDDDPTEQYDPQTYAGLQATCDMQPENITEGQIYSFVGQGKDGGITAKQARSLVELRQNNIDDIGKVQNEIHRRYQGILSRMWKDGMIETATEYAETANKLTVFANTNKEATSADYEQFFSDLTKESQGKSWFKIGANWLTGLSPVRLYGTLQEAKDVRQNVIESVQKQLAVRKRIEEGRIVTIKGEQWRLVKRGETPDKDVYERVE